MPKIIFDREELLGKFKIASNFVPDKAVIAAYETYLCRVKDKVMYITATDGQKQITLSCEIIKSDGDGMFTIPAKNAMHVLSLLIEKEVTITTKNIQVEIKSGKSRYNMSSESGNDYPLMPQIKADYEASFTGVAFNQAIETAKRYVDSESAVPAYMGICFRMKNSNIHVLGTNAHHLCKVVVKPRSINNWDDVTVPIQAIKAINKCVSDEDIVDIIHNKDKFEVKTDNVTIVALAFNTRYPDVDKFFEQRPAHSIELNTVQFLHALERLDMFTKKELPAIKIDIKTANMILTAADDAYNHDGEEEIDIISQNEMAIGMNIKMLTNIIKSFTNDSFKFCYTAPELGIQIEPINVIKENDRFFLVMPIKLD